MRAQPQQDGLHSLYPPRIADWVDVTPQVEDGVERFVIRNRKTARYFLLKKPEYLIFEQIDGAQTVEEISRGGRAGQSPQVSTAALIRFLSKLDSLGLLARGGQDDLTVFFHGSINISAGR
jgi:hypothetical protein